MIDNLEEATLTRLVEHVVGNLEEAAGLVEHVSGYLEEAGLSGTSDWQS